MRDSPWFMRFHDNPTARLRLFCFHFAGGSAAAFHEWHRHLPSFVEVVAVQLPGRGRRRDDPLLSRVEDVVQALIADFRAAALDKPYLCFGHSVGALLAYELSCELQTRGERLPEHLIVSARKAAHLPTRDARDSRLPDEEFIERLRSFDGTPDEVLQDHELVQFLLPMLRADFGLVENYVHRAHPKLRCELTALGGYDDPFATPAELDAWSQLTEARFQRRMFRGGHFYLRTASAPLLHELAILAARHAPPAGHAAHSRLA